jgi:hypothetical protein
MDYWVNLELYILDDAGGSWEVQHARLLLIPATQSGLLLPWSWLSQTLPNKSYCLRISQLKKITWPTGQVNLFPIDSFRLWGAVIWKKLLERRPFHFDPLWSFTASKTQAAGDLCKITCGKMYLLLAKMEWASFLPRVRGFQFVAT